VVHFSARHDRGRGRDLSSHESAAAALVGAPEGAADQVARVLVHEAAEGARRPELRRVGGGRGRGRGGVLGGGRDTSGGIGVLRGPAGRIGEDGVGVVDEAERHLGARVRVLLPEEEREAAEGAGHRSVVGDGPGRQLEDGERVRVARGGHELGGEEDVGDGEELVGAREERVRLHRPLREALAADEVARREELLGDLQPALRLRLAVAGVSASAAAAAPAPARGEVHGGLGEEMGWVRCGGGWFGFGQRSRCPTGLYED